MKDDSSIREARAEMDAAKAQSERTFSDTAGMPRRYRLYDKLKDHVSLKTVDTVIIVTALKSCSFQPEASPTSRARSAEQRTTTRR